MIVDELKGCEIKMKMRNGFVKSSMAAMTLAGMGITVGVALAQGGGMAPPFAGGGMKPMTLAEAMKMAPQQDKSLVPLANAVNAADAKLKKSPKDAAAKKAYVEAEYKFGHAAEYESALSPRIKYRAALAAYRNALTVDPRHQPSQTEKLKIEDIYRSMPGGIPTK